MNKIEFAKCMKTSHKMEDYDMFFSEEGHYPFPTEKILLKTCKCSHCGVRQVLAFDDTDKEWKDYEKITGR